MVMHERGFNDKTIISRTGRKLSYQYYPIKNHRISFSFKGMPNVLSVWNEK